MVTPTTESEQGSAVSSTKSTERSRRGEEEGQRGGASREESSEVVSYRQGRERWVVAGAAINLLLRSWLTFLRLQGRDEGRERMRQLCWSHSGARGDTAA